jgi:hypothetical protein
MKCPVCQGVLIETSPRSGYCNVLVKIYRYSASHYEHYMSYEGGCKEVYHSEIVRIPPFTIVRQENGYLEVTERFELSVLTVLQKDNSVSTDLLNYYHRFKNLRIFS